MNAILDLLITSIPNMTHVIERIIKKSTTPVTMFDYLALIIKTIVNIPPIIFTVPKKYPHV